MKMHELDGVKKIKDFGKKIGGARKDMYSGRRGSEKEKSIYEGYYVPQPELSGIKNLEFTHVMDNLKCQYDLDKIDQLYKESSEEERGKYGVMSAGMWNLYNVIHKYWDKVDDLPDGYENMEYADLMFKYKEDFDGYLDNGEKEILYNVEVIIVDCPNNHEDDKGMRHKEYVNFLELTPLSTTYNFLISTDENVYYYDEDTNIFYRVAPGNSYCIDVHCDGFCEWMKLLKFRYGWKFNQLDLIEYIPMECTPLHFTLGAREDFIINNENQVKKAGKIFEAMQSNATCLNIYSDEDLIALKKVGYPVKLINRLSLLSYNLQDAVKSLPIVDNNNLLRPLERAKERFSDYNTIDELVAIFDFDISNVCIAYNRVDIRSAKIKCGSGRYGFGYYGSDFLNRNFNFDEIEDIDEIIPYGYMKCSDGIWYKRNWEESEDYYCRKCKNPLKGKKKEEEEEKPYRLTSICWTDNKDEKLIFATRCPEWVLDNQSIPLKVAKEATADLSNLPELPKFDFKFSFIIFKQRDGYEIYTTRGEKKLSSKFNFSFILIEKFDSLDYLTNFDNWVSILNKAYSMLSGYDERRGDCRYRKGVRWRDEKKDVTEKDFMKVFGFRGVEFGNYVTGTERHLHMNATFDAFCDMAAMLGIPNELVSLNGTLALAFGSRGRGGKGAPSAHYESGYKVINLTRPHGAGSLAHEWWHAFDNYVGEWILKNDVFDTSNFKEKMVFLSHLIYPSKFEPSMRCGQLITNYRSWFRRSKHLNEISNKSDKNYWTRPTEIAARCFETYMRYRLSEYGYKNDYLCGEHYYSEYYPYPIFEDDGKFKKDEDANLVVEYFNTLFSSVVLLSKYFDNEDLEIKVRTKQELESEHGVSETLMEERKKKETKDTNETNVDEQERMRILRLKAKAILAIMEIEKTDWANIPID